MIVLNSNFNPYSYQELAAPVLQAEQAHRQIEEEDAQLQAMAGNWKTKLNPELDKKSYAAVADLYGQIEQQVGELASKGLTPGSRKALLNLKANYNTKVSPIEEAYKIRQMRADELAKMKMQDPTTLYDLDPGMLSVDDFVSNPNKRVNTYSGAVITKQVADAAEQMSKSLRTDPNARAKWKNILGNQYFEKLDKYGFSSSEVMDAIQRNPKASKELTSLVTNVMSSTGIDKWGNAEQYQKALNFANQGLYHAIGTSQYKELKNDYLDQMLKKKQLEALEAKESSNVVPYTLIPKDLESNKKEFKSMNYSQFMNDAKFIQSVLSNPDIADPKAHSNQRYKLANIKMPSGMTDPTQIKNFVNNWEKGSPVNVATANYNRLQTLYKKYGTVDIQALNNIMQNKSNRMASIGNNYQFELADNSLAMEKLRDRFASKSSFGNSGIYKQSDDGSISRKAINNSDVHALFTKDDKSAPTLVFDTDHNALTVVKGGVRYKIDPNVIDPSGKLNGYINKASTYNKYMNDAADDKTFDAYSTKYENTMRDIMTSTGVLLNSFELKQSESGKEK